MYYNILYYIFGFRWYINAHCFVYVYFNMLLTFYQITEMVTSKTVFIHIFSLMRIVDICQHTMSYSDINIIITTVVTIMFIICFIITTQSDPVNEKSSQRGDTSRFFGEKTTIPRSPLAIATP